MTTPFDGASFDFKATFEQYSQDAGFTLAEADERKAVITFTMDSGRPQTLFIIRYDETLEFSVPSMAAFDSEEEIPGGLSTVLLQRNARRKMGFWAVEEIGEKQVYSVMHNLEIEDLDPDQFSRLTLSLVQECDDFEGMLISANGPDEDATPETPSSNGTNPDNTNISKHGGGKP